MIAETSRRALAEVNKRLWYGRIRDLMRRSKKQDWCISEVAYWLGGEQHSTISARLNEMRAYGWLVSAGTRKSDVTGIESNVYRLK